MLMLMTFKLTFISVHHTYSASKERAVQAMQNCVADIKPWARQHYLMPNDGKTELLALGTR